MTEAVDREFEETAKLVLEFLQGLGYGDASLMPDAGAGLYDIDSENAVVEVTVGAPPSRPDVQRLDGVSRSEDRPAFYFSVRGFTSSAKEWASNVNIALFEFDRESNEILAVNDTATEVMTEPPTPEEALLEAASRALELAKEELKEAQMSRETDEETMKRINAARERKARRRDFLT
jgi:hypothetical protein